jgi:uncharacterized protein YndB with AHSA1/START domain
MTDQTTAASDQNGVRRNVLVDAPQEVAFCVFTEKMRAWWPLTTHKIGNGTAVDAVMEPRVDGLWYELDEDGTKCPWGRVLVWEPPTRLVLSWQTNAEWQHDPTLNTEVELRFLDDGKARTRVELEHRNLDRFGAQRDAMRAAFESENGWSGLLELFAKVANATPSS